MEKNLNLLLYDPIKFAEKEGNDPSHVYRFNRNYEDGGADFLHSQFEYGKEELTSHEVVKPGDPSRDPDFPNGYYVADGRGVITAFFFDYYVKNGRLLKDDAALIAFKSWFERVAVDWLNRNGFVVTVKRDKPGEYWLKITGKIEVVAGS